MFFIFVYEIYKQTFAERYCLCFSDMWYQIFLYCLATTVLMHGLASLIALRALRKHKLGRYIPIVIAVAGFLYPLTGGIITSKTFLPFTLTLIDLSLVVLPFCLGV